MELGLGGAAEFWLQTPRLVGIAIAARLRAAEREHKDRAWLAHTTASLGRVKRLPKLADLTKAAPEKRKKVKPKTADEMLSIARMWAAVA